MVLGTGSVVPMSATNCTFCSIVAGESNAEVVWENDHVLAFMDLLPMTDGHLLIVPKCHRRDLLDLEADDGHHLMRAAAALGNALMRGMGAKGLNLLHNTGTHADQSQFHFHFHLIPRYGNDRLLHPWERRWGNWPDIMEHAGRIRRGLQPD